MVNYIDEQEILLSGNDSETPSNDDSSRETRKGMLFSLVECCSSSSWYAATTFNAATNTFRHAGVCLMLHSLFLATFFGNFLRKYIYIYILLHNYGLFIVVVLTSKKR